jgi:hypothetical protein
LDSETEKPEKLTKGLSECLTTKYFLLTLMLAFFEFAL